MYTLGALLLLAVLLGAVTAVIDSVLGVLKVSDTIRKLPVIGTHWGLGISILMIWLLDITPAAGWGLMLKDDWMNIVAGGAIVYGMIPVKDAVINMVNKGLRA